MGNKNWREKLIYALYIFAILNIIVSTERMVFDVFGHMWITLFINGLTGLTSFICIMGLYFRKKSAIIAYILCGLTTLGINLVIVLMYNNIGLLKGTEQYLSLPMKSESWWNDHGFFCYTICSGSQTNGGGGSNGDNSNTEGSGGVGLSLIDGTLLLEESPDIHNIAGSGDVMSEQACFISYAVIESSHATLNALLILIMILLSALMLLKEKEAPEEESFRYMNIGRYGGNATTLATSKRNRNPQSYYKLSDSFNTIGTVTTGGSDSFSSSM